MTQQYLQLANWCLTMMYHNKTLWNLLVLITRGRVSRFVISFIPSQMIAEALEAQSGNEAVRLKVHTLSYCHTGSFSHPWGKPIAAISIPGYALSNVFNLLVISFWGDTILRKYLMMHKSKYTRSGSAGRVIQLPVIRFGIIGRIVFCLFQTRAWWQQ